MQLQNLLTKNIYLYAALVLFLILFLIGLKSTENSTLSPSPIPSPQFNTNNADSPEAKLMEKISNRKKLSETDAAAKKDLLNMLPIGKNSGTIYQMPNFTIEYIQSPDLFKVEINNVDVDSTKASAVQWFYDHGFTPEGVCDLPLSFYLNFEISKQIDQSTFNPLPDDC